MKVLVVNAGSSSIKLSVLSDSDELLGDLDLEMPSPGLLRREISKALSRLPRADAVGHRVVHGGELFIGPVVIDSQVVSQLEQLVDLAPLHQPAGLAAIKAVSDELPELKAVACFDTAFHATLPARASTYAVPEEWRKKGVRRYGFHGLSHSYAARRIAQLLDRPVTSLRSVTCHLGAGASLAAVDRGRSVDTTMGFTPLDGLVMATRPGSLDPGVVTWVMAHLGFSLKKMEDALDLDCGLAGLAGDGDMRRVLERSLVQDKDAELALEVYTHRLRGEIAQMAAAMGGLDALVFTGGVGERSHEIRERALKGLGFLGLELDPVLNEQGSHDRLISSEASIGKVAVVRAREDLEIAWGVRQVLS